MSLDDRQNIVIDHLKFLNDAVTKAKTTRLHKEALHRQSAISRRTRPDVPGLAQNPTIQESRSNWHS